MLDLGDTRASILFQDVAYIGQSQGGWNARVQRTMALSKVLALTREPMEPSCRSAGPYNLNRGPTSGQGVKDSVRWRNRSDWGRSSFN